MIKRGKVISMRGRGGEYRFKGSPPGSVRIDRKTKWGNRVKGGPVEYTAMIMRDMREGRITLAEIAGLHGKDLACWCKPAWCHGDILIALAEHAYNVKKKEEEQGHESEN